MGGQHEQASMAITGFAVALALYSLSFVAYVSFVQTPAGKQQDAPHLDSRATGGVEELVGTGSDWHRGDPDNIARFGLAPLGRPGSLDPDKLRNLTRGNTTRDAANDKLDYEEARAALGLGEFAFHLRTFPLLAPLADAGAGAVKGPSVAYVGDFESQTGGSSSYLVQYATSVEDRGTPVHVNVTVTNNGTTATVFQATFRVPLEEGRLVDTATTGLLAPLASQTLSLKLYKTDAWEWADGDDRKVSVTITDPKKTVASFTIDLASIDMRAGPDDGHAALTADADKLSFRTNQQPRVDFDLWEGDGGTEDDGDVNISIHRSSDGAIVRGWEGELGRHNRQDFPALEAGHYVVRIRKVGDGAFNSTDGFLVTDGDLGEFTPPGVTTLVEKAASAYERALLAYVVDRWTDLTYDRAGDVYPDQAAVMNNDLAANLTSKYGILVLGSDADHNALAGSSARLAVRDFVQRGGLVIALGTQAQSLTWLEPLLQDAASTSSDSLREPDPTHPALHVPQDLAFGTYTSAGLGWRFGNPRDAVHFSHVLTQGSDPEDVLAVSKSGHFGNGTLVLTSWELAQLAPAQDDQEARAALHNLLSQGLSPYFLDLGPRIPDHAEVGTGTRVATAPHPWLEGDRLLVRVTLYVFR